MVDSKTFILNESSGRLELHPAYFSSMKLHESVFLDTLPLEHKSIRIFGREVIQPRLICFMGDEGIEYTYSRSTIKAESWNKEVSFIRDELFRIKGLRFNSALLNYYRNGRDSMGLHADDEAELGGNPTIASVSFGCSRNIIFKHNDDRRKVKIALSHGDLLIMSGAIQHQWKHELPKAKNVDCGRLNITFRNILK